MIIPQTARANGVLTIYVGLWAGPRLACSTQILSRLNLSQREKHKEFDFGVRSRWPRRCPVVPHREKQLEQDQLEQKQLEQNSFEQKQLEQNQLELVRGCSPQH